MKKGVVFSIIFGIILIVSLFGSFVSAIGIYNNHCDTLPGNTIGSFNVGSAPSGDCNNYIGGDSCYDGEVVVSCGTGATGFNWWLEPCGYGESCTDVVPCTSYTWYHDTDGDGYYDTTKYSCDGGTGWTTLVKIAGDCNDSNVSINPGALEIIDSSVVCNYTRITDKITSGGSRCNNLAGTLTLPQLPCDTRPGGDDCSDPYSYISQEDICIGKFATIKSKTGYLACENTETQPCTDCADVPRVIIFNLTSVIENGIDENCNGLIDEGILINKPHWADLLDSSQNISTAQIGDTVLMYVPGVGLTQPINYTIYQNITGANVWQRFLNWLTRNTGLEYQTSSVGLQLWQTSIGRFYFEATILNASNFSDELEVSGNGDANPVAIILSPTYNEKFSVNSLMSFTHESYDEDDLLNITWDFGDGNITSFYNYSLALTPGLGNVLHTYTDNGVYNIKLTAKEMTREKFSTDMRTIYIFNEGINVFPVISNPQNGIGYGNWVLFNASASFVANCTYGVMPVAYFSAGNLNCSYLHAPNTASITGNYEIILNWTVYTGPTQSLVKTGNWSINYDSAVVFNHFFLNPARHDARLDINYLAR